MASTLTPPAVMWAQRNSSIFLTICLEDCQDSQIKIDNDKIYFKGIGGTEKKEHEVTINLHKDIDSEKSSYKVRDRNIELILKKKDNTCGYWPYLTKEKRLGWLKVDFNRWQDEEQSAEEDEDNFNKNNSQLDALMKSMGGLGGDGDSKPNFDFNADAASDSDDEDLPDLE